jgi:hypothetical protein
MFCGAPPEVAPNLMGMQTDDRGYPHCYFRRQPENDVEVDEAIAGMNASCCGAVCYVGNDKKILKKIAQFPMAVRPIISDPSWTTTPRQGFFARLFKRST